MKMVYALALVCAAFTGVARGESGILAQHVPGGADPEAVNSAVKGALNKHSWTITGADAASVSAEIDHKANKCTIRIENSQGRLVYEANCQKARRTGGPSQSVVVVDKHGDVPKRWIEGLRKDINNALVMMPERR